jgi:hypothetical protein
MTRRVYKSTDAGAPSLTNAAGSLIPVLDCLVNGLGSIPGAGWTKPFTGTQKAVYKQGAGSNGFYLRVDDSVVSMARAVGYEQMTTVDAGTNAFPTETQFSGGLYIPKSASAAAVPWVLIATEKYFWLNVSQANEATFLNAQVIHFGDFISRKPGDLFNTIFIGGSTATIGTASQFSTTPANITTLTGGHYICRPHTQVGSSLQTAKTANQGLAGGGIGVNATGILTYPSQITGGIELAKILLGEGANVRGYLAGVSAPLHVKPLGQGDTYTPTSGDFVGKTFMAMNFYNTGQALFEIQEAD